MAYVSKVWTNRQSEYPNRRVITHEDLTQEVVSVNRSEGTIYQVGDAVDAQNMNGLESRISAGFNEKQDTLTAGTGITITGNVISATGGGGSTALDDLTDVDISNPSNGQALIYDSANSKWINGTGGGSSTLAGLTDVTVTLPTDGQMLKYDSTSDKWLNVDIPLPWKDITGTLVAGNTTLTLSDASITTNSTIQCFYGVDGIDDPQKSVSTGSITLTFAAALSADLAVKVRVS